MASEKSELEWGRDRSLTCYLETKNKKLIDKIMREYSQRFESGRHFITALMKGHPYLKHWLYSVSTDAARPAELFQHFLLFQIPAAAVFNFYDKMIRSDWKPHDLPAKQREWWQREKKDKDDKVWVLILRAHVESTKWQFIKNRSYPSLKKLIK